MCQLNWKKINDGDRESSYATFSTVFSAEVYRSEAGWYYSVTPGIAEGGPFKGEIDARHEAEQALREHIQSLCEFFERSPTAQRLIESTKEMQVRRLEATQMYVWTKLRPFLPENFTGDNLYDAVDTALDNV